MTNQEYTGILAATAPNPEACMQYKMLVMSPAALLDILERVAAGEEAQLVMLEVLDISEENRIKLGDTENGGR